MASPFPLAALIASTIVAVMKSHRKWLTSLLSPLCAKAATSRPTGRSEACRTPSLCPRHYSASSIGGSLRRREGLVGEREPFSVHSVVRSLGARSRRGSGHVPGGGSTLSQRKAAATRPQAKSAARNLPGRPGLGAPWRACKAKVFSMGGAAVIPWLNHGLQDVARFTGWGDVWAIIGIQRGR